MGIGSARLSFESVRINRAPHGSIAGTASADAMQARRRIERAQLARDRGRAIVGRPREA